MSNTEFFQEIITRVADYYGISESEIMNTYYGKDNAFRDEAIYICRKATNAKLIDVGNFFNIAQSTAGNRIAVFGSILAIENKLRRHITEQIQFYEMRIKEKNISEKIIQHEAELILMREQKKKISEQLHNNKFYSNENF